MKSLFVVLAAFTTFSTFAIYEVGDVIPNQCWQDVNEKPVCLQDYSGTVKVLVHNTGWCPDCQEEFEVLVPRALSIASQPVTFISLSAAGWTKNSPPDKKFLTEWKAKYHIPFAVCASPKDAGKQYFEQTFIPNFVIIDKTGKLAFKSYEASLDEVFAVIEKLAAQ